MIFLFIYKIHHQASKQLTSLIGLVEKKFGIAIEAILWLNKANELVADLKKIQPLLFCSEKTLAQKIKDYFQFEFNVIANTLLL